MRAPYRIAPQLRRDAAAALGASEYTEHRQGTNQRFLASNGAASCRRWLGCRQADGWMSTPTLRAPTLRPSVADVMVAPRSVIPTGPHAALLESGDRSHRGTGHYARASRGALCLRAPLERHA